MTTSMQAQTDRRYKCALACNFCRLKKAKCNGGNPCPNCIDHRQVCIYPASQRRTHRTPRKDARSTRQRLEHVEALLKGTREGSERTGTIANTPKGWTEAPLTPHLTIAASSGDDDGVGVLSPEEDPSYEYHGPGSFISFCSKSCVDWVCEKTEAQDFSAMARKVTYDISRQLKIEPGISLRRESEPEEALAWQYVKAYFEETRDVAFGILSRPVFESRLRTHFENSPTTPELDASWYALRNVVYATGCRKAMARELPGPFLVGQGYGWQYFQNAPSVHTDLLYSRSSFMAVQALAIMAFFAESIGSPALDSMLSLSAMKLAESKGLHRQPTATWNLAEAALQTRSYIWWSVYGLERFNAFRWGRPLSIEDKAITCDLPSKIVDGSMVNLDLLIPAVKHAQILGDIMSQLGALKASTPTLPEVVRTISNLEQKLRYWHDSLPPNLRTGTDYSDFPESMDFVHVLYHHYAFWGSLVTIHSILVHPWNAPEIKTKPIELLDFRKYSRDSMTKVVEASRAMIRSLRHVPIDICSPKWLVFTYPLTAFMNLFIYILQYPTLGTVGLDLEAMDRVCGHFSYMEYISSEMAFTFPREATNLARLTATKAKANANRGVSKASEVNSLRGTATSISELPEIEAPLSFDASLTEPIEFEAEKWDTFFSWPGGDEVAAMEFDPPCGAIWQQPGTDLL